MKTCDTCKWWAEFKFESDPRYTKPYEPQEQRICKNKKMDDYSQDGASIETDCEGAVILTGAKFGCIYQEPK